jgi:CHRD domain-containing protein
MRRSLLTIALVACALQTQAQGTFEFNATLTGANEVPPNNDPTVGTATLSLTGVALSFYVYVPAITFVTSGGTINGPALPGANGPVLFDLGLPHFHSGGGSGNPPFYSFGLPIYTLTTDQINQLEAGLWYINITSFVTPAGQLRGQISAVPEPSVFSLLLIGSSILWCLRRWR